MPDENLKEALGIFCGFAALLVLIFIFGSCCSVVFQDGKAHGAQEVRTSGCTGACERRGTTISHIHDENAMCVCEDGQTLTLDYGAMYRPISE